MEVQADRQPIPLHYFLTEENILKLIQWLPQIFNALMIY